MWIFKTGIPVDVVQAPVGKGETTCMVSVVDLALTSTPCLAVNQLVCQMLHALPLTLMLTTLTDTTAGC